VRDPADYDFADLRSSEGGLLSAGASWLDLLKIEQRKDDRP